MGFLGGIRRGLSNAVSYVKETVSRAFERGREKAIQAMDYIAEKGERFIDNVKSTLSLIHI